MRRVILSIGMLVLLVPLPTLVARPLAHSEEPSFSGKPFKAAGLTFLIPWRWMGVPTESLARVGRWTIPPLHDRETEGADLVVFYFGAGVGGSAQENFFAWSNLITTVEGNPTTSDLKTHVTAGFKITQGVFFGTYTPVASIPGLPPLARPNYGLAGAVVENGQGNLYWQLTGPVSLVTATLPLFSKMLDSVKLQDKP